MGCTKGTSESKRETLINNDKSVESNLEDTNDKIDEDLVNEDLSEITLSYDYKTISFDDWQVDIPSSWIEGFHCNSLMVTKTHNVYSLQLDDYAYDRIPTKFYVLLIIGGYLLNENVL